MTIPEILTTYRTIAVFGLSSSVWRPSFAVTEYMKSRGYTIYPVNPNETEVLGIKAVAELGDLEDPIDIVNIFRRPEHVTAIVDDAIRLGTKVIWMQEGVVNEDAAARARSAGLDVVMDRCILKEHMNLG